MVLRLLMRYFANNEQLVQRLSESYPVRRAAQMVVSVFYRGKIMAEEKGLHELTPQRFRNLFRSFKEDVQKEIEAAKEELKKRK